MRKATISTAAFVLLCCGCTTSSGTPSPMDAGLSVDTGANPPTDAPVLADTGNGGADRGGSDLAVDVAPDAAAVMPIPGTCSPPLDIKKPYAKLSETGCVNPQNPKMMADVVIPYQINSPLWSDASLKTRGMVIPANGKIHVKDCMANPMECCVRNPDMRLECLPPGDDGAWVFPVGTVMIKNFMFSDGAAGMKFVETRLFVRFDERTWVGYGYRWNEAQTDATIVAVDGETATFTVAAQNGPQTIQWSYPSRADCMQCHTPAKPIGGSVLGPETIQMNKMLPGGMNQLDMLVARGLFDVPPPKPYKAALVAPYAGPDGTPPANATLAQRARSYLHANCAFCHRPDQSFDQIDLRFDGTVNITAAGLCNGVPAKSALGVPDATVLTPQTPAKSVLHMRLIAPPTDLVNGNRGRMPPVASAVIDTDGAKLISDWITSITTCPAP